MKFFNAVQCWLLIVFFGFTGLTMAKVQPSVLISDNMVLQRNTKVPIWGWATAGETVRVTFNGQHVDATADASGKWTAVLEPMSAGGPFEMRIAGLDTASALTIKNVLIGEVWLCSGQSNMEWLVRNSMNAEEEIASADYSQIRHFEVPKRVALSPLDRLSGGAWQVCSPESVGDFTAVGYFFARELYKNLQIPIGLLHASWGGTVVETWISAGAIKNVPAFQDSLRKMASMDLDRMKAEALSKLHELVGEVPTADGGMTDGKAVWAAENLNAEQWNRMTLPVLWENAGLAGLDGIVWFRREFTLPEDTAKAEYMLNLGPIDDSDVTWINGVKIGEMTQKYNVPRVYQIPNEILKTGRNVVVVRVDDTGGGGGLWGSPEQLFVQAGEQTISLAGEWLYKVGMGTVNFTVSPNSKPTLLFNGMIDALIPYGMRGAIWYQGESNASRAYQYRTLFPMLIKDWRNYWNIGDFPFLFVQLANFQAAMEQPGESEWAELREAQAMTLKLPNTGQAVTIDIGDANDIHPRNKQEVGRRLALAARKIAYGQNVVYSGPTHKSMKIEGNKVRIGFDHSGSGLIAKDKYGYLKGFTVAGADKKFHWAKAEFDGQDVIVYSDKVPKPVAVRYAWANNPDDANLYNKEGLPASPFRTDVWDGLTIGKN